MHKLKPPSHFLLSTNMFYIETNIFIKVYKLLMQKKKITDKLPHKLLHKFVFINLVCTGLMCIELK